jgi:hypothetical protein
LARRLCQYEPDHETDGQPSQRLAAE